MVSENLFRSLISIHAPRGGSDQSVGVEFAVAFQFQSTLPVGGATTVRLHPRKGKIFQSTLPVGGATQNALHHQPGIQYFNPRSPWGERL